MFVFSAASASRVYDANNDEEEDNESSRFATTIDLNAEESIESFAFGRGEGEGCSWLLFCLSVLTTSGRIFVVCPVVPFNCSIPSKYLQNEEILLKSIGGSLSRTASAFLSNVLVGVEDPIAAASASSA